MSTTRTSEMLTHGVSLLADSLLFGRPWTTFEADDVDTPGETPSGNDDNDNERDNGSDSETVEQLRARLKRVNDESAARRHRIEELEAAEAQRKKDEMTEAERLKTEAEEAKAALENERTRQRERNIRHAVEMAAATMGFHDPRDAVVQADLSGVEIADDGGVRNVESALNALKKQKPYLLKTGGDSNTNAGDGGTDEGISYDELKQRKEKSFRFTAL